MCFFTACELDTDQVLNLIPLLESARSYSRNLEKAHANECLTRIAQIKEAVIYRKEGNSKKGRAAHQDGEKGPKQGSTTHA
jgi:hypothetical protein